MTVIEFPPVEDADEDGLLAVGGDLNIPTLLMAYSNGIFPWPVSEDYPLAWFSPDPRGILFYENLKISKSLKKLQKKEPFSFSFNQNFKEVILNCSKIKNRKNQTSTWITNDIIHTYLDLYHSGYAYSVEAKNSKGEIVGGIYGVNIGKYFSGESMFFKESNASKLALIYLMEFLHNKDIHWLDTQMVTPVVETLGGTTLPRKKFIVLLKNALNTPVTEKVFY